MTAAVPSAPQHGDGAALAGALLCAAFGAAYGIATGAGAALPVAPQLHGTPAEFVAIAARNIAVCSALILASHVQPLRRRWPRNVIDVLAFLVLAPSTFTAAVVATHPNGPALLPHAPLELGAVALAASWWWRHHEIPPTVAATRRRLLLVTSGLLIAAALETFAVPHR